MQTKKSFNYWQWRVIICSMIGYSMFYFVRKNLSFAMPLLNKEFGISNAEFGAILTAASSAVGLIGFMSYISTLITGYPLGKFADTYGWHSIFIIMAVVSVIGGLCVAILWNLKKKA